MKFSFVKGKRKNFDFWNKFGWLSLTILLFIWLFLEKMWNCLSCTAKMCPIITPWFFSIWGNYGTCPVASHIYKIYLTWGKYRTAFFFIKGEVFIFYFVNKSNLLLYFLFIYFFHVFFVLTSVFGSAPTHNLQHNAPKNDFLFITNK